jgi:outer membrane protein assembly factor BamA
LLGCAIQCVLLFANMPTDSELHDRGARIGKIQIAVDDVFEQSLSLAAPYRIVNSLHISTHVATVNQQLLFREGDAFDRRVLEETERLLREQRYLADASIETLRYNDDNTVDVLVRVHDVWTMSPGVSFGRKGGENSTRFEFEDTNFLGLGKTVAVERSANVDRSAWRLGYVDPHVFGSWWRLSAAHSTLSDGTSDELAFGRPFYSLDSRWSAGVSAVDSKLVTPLYSLGKQIGRFDTQTQTFAFDGGVSRGLVDGWTKRYLFGARYDAKRFMPDPNDPDAFVPDDRRYAYPYVGVQWLEDSYVTTRNLNQIGRTEDLHLGKSLTMTAGFAASALGSTSNAMMLTASGEAGYELDEEQFFLGTFAFASRVESGGVRNALFDLGGRYYLRQSEHRVFFAGLDATYSSHLDADTQLLLGGDNGLRGYPLRFQAGTSQAVMTLEQRFYTDWQPFRLANVGAALFADTGRMWGQDRFAAAPQGWLSDVGVGLRLGSARSGLGSILHIDVAFPLNRTSDIDAVQFLVETKKSF